MIQLFLTILSALRAAKRAGLDPKEALACIGCHDVLITSDPKSHGWHWGTQFDGDHHWICRDCRSQDREDAPR